MKHYKAAKNGIHRSNIKYGSVLFGALSIFAFFTVLNSSDVAIEYMKKGLKLCASTVIPSLFPFMVISELIVSSGIGLRMASFLAAPMRRFFGVSEAGACAYLLGTLCGFPIGAKSAVGMYDRGEISKEELVRLMTFCNNPGSAFIISAVGVSLFGSQITGIALYACVIISSLVVGIGIRIIFGPVKDSVATSSVVKKCDEVGIGSFTSAIHSSATSMLTVCAYVVFFSALVGCIGNLLSLLELPRNIMAVIFAFFELSSGVGTCAEYFDGSIAVIACAAAAGWSGLSVHFQIMSICSGRGISFKPYFFAKLAQGVICAALAALSTMLILPALFPDYCPTFLPVEDHAIEALPVLVGILIMVLCPLVINFLIRKKLVAKKEKKIKKGLDKLKIV